MSSEGSQQSDDRALKSTAAFPAILREQEAVDVDVEQSQPINISINDDHCNGNITITAAANDDDDDAADDDDDDDANNPSCDNDENDRDCEQYARDIERARIESMRSRPGAISVSVEGGIQIQHDDDERQHEPDDERDDPESGGNNFDEESETESVVNNMNIDIDDELDRLGICRVEAEAVPVEVEDGECGDDIIAHAENRAVIALPSENHDVVAPPSENHVIVHAEPVKTISCCFGKEIPTSVVVALVAILVSMISIVVAVTVTTGKGSNDAPDVSDVSSSSAQDPLDLDDAGNNNIVGEGKMNSSEAEALEDITSPLTDEEEQEHSPISEDIVNSISIMPDIAILHTPPMPASVSQILSKKRTVYKQGTIGPIAFSGDCTIVAVSLVDEFNTILQTIQYEYDTDINTNTTKPESDEDGEWTLLGEEFANAGNTDGDRYGAWLDVSDDGMVMAVAMPRDDPGAVPDAGSVRVYTRRRSDSDSDDDDAPENITWTPMGADIHGTDPNGWMGTVMSLSADGNMIATAAMHGASKKGLARVHRFDANDNEWKQVGGDIVGEMDESRLSYARLCADGSTLVVGAHLDSTVDENSGSVRIFRLDTDVDVATDTEEWVQVGGGIYGETAGAQFGTFPHVSRDGQIVAFSGFAGNGLPLPRSHVYSYDSEEEEWVQKGKTFQNTFCMGLSSDGKRTITCSVFRNACFIYSFNDDENDWEEMATFDADEFLPLAFSVDGKEACGIGSSAPDGYDDAPTIAFYPLN